MPSFRDNQWRSFDAVDPPSGDVATDDKNPAPPTASTQHRLLCQPEDRQAANRMLRPRHKFGSTDRIVNRSLQHRSVQATWWYTSQSCQIAWKLTSIHEVMHELCSKDARFDNLSGNIHRHLAELNKFLAPDRRARHGYPNLLNQLAIRA